MSAKSKRISTERHRGESSGIKLATPSRQLISRRNHLTSSKSKVPNTDVAQSLGLGMIFKDLSTCSKVGEYKDMQIGSEEVFAVGIFS